MTVRTFRPIDLAAVVQVLSSSMSMDATSPDRFTRQVLLDPNFRAEGAIVAELDGEIVGFMLAIARQVPLENAAPDFDRGYITLAGVAPAARRRGVGSAMLEAAERFLLQQSRSTVMVSPYAPGYFNCGVDVANYEPALRMFSKHGYKEVYRPIAMEIPLWRLETPGWLHAKLADLHKSGVTIQPFENQWAVPVLEFTATEFAGDWVRVYRQTMAQITQGEHADRVILAHDGMRVLGVSHYEGERFGPIGVAREERGRCIGQGLMYATLHAQRSRGMKTAWFMWSDDATAAKLYAPAGFRVIRRFALLRKDLSAT
jgi:ribosomal protein S18 acetylase RimI-like enzyme